MQGLHTIRNKARGIFLFVGNNIPCEYCKETRSYYSHESCLRELADRQTTGFNNIWYCECPDCKKRSAGAFHIFVQDPSDRMTTVHFEEMQTIYVCLDCRDGNHAIDLKPEYRTEHTCSEWRFGACVVCETYDRNHDQDLEDDVIDDLEDEPDEEPEF